MSSSIDSQILRMAGKLSHEAIKIEYKGESLAQKQSEFVSVSAELADLEEEKKNRMNEFKDRIKPIKVEHSRLLDITRKGYEVVHKEVKCLANDDNGTIEFYDTNSGELIGERRQYPNERPVMFVKVENEQ